MAFALAYSQHAPGDGPHGLQKGIIAGFCLLRLLRFLAVFCHAVQLPDTMLQIVQAMTPKAKASRHKAVWRFLRRCSGVSVMAISLPEAFQKYGRGRATAPTIPGRLRLPMAGPVRVRRSC